MTIVMKEVLAFVHIEKAAGTTLNHILRSNFLFQHVDIRPFSPASNKVFQHSDLNKVFKICPWVKSISGHSLYPTKQLTDSYPQFKYITLFRSPANRYLSQFQYWRENLNYDITFKHFLSREHAYNLQTRKIAGSVNLDKAIDILESGFFLVGVVEEFNEFLLMLKQKLFPIIFDPGYRQQNIGSKSSNLSHMKNQIYETYQKEILERNSVDAELYKYVTDIILPRQRKLYGPSLQADLLAFQKQIESFRWGTARYFDYIFRKLYLDPTIGFLRKMSGLPYKGSY